MIIDNIEELIRLDKEIDASEQRSDENLRAAHQARWEFGRLMLAARQEGGRGRGRGLKLPVGYLAVLADRTGKGQSDLKQRMWLATSCPTEDELVTAVTNSDGTYKPWSAVRRGLAEPPEPDPAFEPLPPKPVSERKAGPKPKPTAPPQPNPRRDEMIERAEQGFTQTEIAQEIGVPKDTLRRELERDAIERDAYERGKQDGTVIGWDGMPEKIRERESVMRTQIRKEVQLEFEPRVQAEVQKRVSTSRREIESLRAEARRVLDTRKGMFTRAEYNLIQSCLHPDSRASVSGEKLSEAFRVFTGAELTLLSEQDYPTTLPSLDELRRRRG